MLTRLKVSGFKNLLDVDVQFGPFTCIAGPNGVGKSNIFDAIHFLSLLANRSLMEAASAVRESSSRTRDIFGLFYRSGDYVADRMDFELELLVPESAEDDFGQRANATITTLKYSLSLGRQAGNGGGVGDSLVLLKEELKHIPIGEARKKLRFPMAPEWRNSVVRGVRRSPYFISTDEASRTIGIHQDGGSSGRPFALQVENLKRTVLAASNNAAESPTILVVRRELQSWLQLQLEPSSLRRSDEYTDPAILNHRGEHVPAALDRLARADSRGGFYSALANRLSELVGGVSRVSSERDDARRLITAYVTFADSTPHPASSLSDGTLRFLALAVMEQDPEFRGLLCLEEPENGIHPERLPAMVRLLGDLAVDTRYPVGPDNPMRQVIINTHSPACVAEVPEDALLYAEPSYVIVHGLELPTFRMAACTRTWRDEADRPTIKKGALIRYLNPVDRSGSGRGRVADRPEVQMEMDFGCEEQ